MDNAILDTLQKMQKEYGEDIFYNFNKATNLLNDLCPKLTQERIQCKNFIELNGYFMLKYAGSSYDIVRNKLIATYVQTYKVDDRTATWIVDIFGNLMGYAAPEPTYYSIRDLETQPSAVLDLPRGADRVRVSDLLDSYLKQSSGRTQKTISKPSYIGSIQQNGEVITPLPGSQYNNSYVSADFHTVAVCENGTVVATGYNNMGQCNVSSWRGIISVSAGAFFTVGLRSDGTVTATGSNEFGQCNVSDWRDIMAISAGARHTIGLKKDGSMVGVGESRYGECDVSGWRNIQTIIAGNQCTYAIKKDKKVLARGNNKHGEYDVSKLSDIVTIANAYPHGALALKSDGTVHKACRSMRGDFRKIKDIKYICATPDCFIGLRKDGTVKILAYYWESSGVECSTDSWRDIVQICPGRYHIIGLRSDGKLEASMLHTHDALNKGQCNVSGWSSIRWR